MAVDLRKFINAARWIADDIRSESVLCELEGLDAAATERRLWRLVMAERRIRPSTFDVDGVPAVQTWTLRTRPHARRLTDAQRARFARDVCIKACLERGVPHRVLARVHGLPHSRIAAIAREDLAARLRKQQGDD